MYQKIISAVDGSFHSELAAHHAVAIASFLGSKLTIVAVDAGEIEREELSHAILRLHQHASTYGVKAKGSGDRFRNARNNIHIRRSWLRFLCGGRVYRHKHPR